MGDDTTRRKRCDMATRVRNVCVTCEALLAHLACVDTVFPCEPIDAGKTDPVRSRSVSRRVRRRASGETRVRTQPRT